MHGEIDNPKDHISIKIAKILLGLSYLFLFWQLVELYRSDLNFDNSIPLVLSCICMLTSTLLSVVTHIKPFAVYSPVAGYVIAVLVMENVNINTGTYIMMILADDGTMHDITSPVYGHVKKYNKKKNSRVERGELLFEMKAN